MLEKFITTCLCLVCLLPVLLRLEMNCLNGSNCQVYIFVSTPNVIISNSEFSGVPEEAFVSLSPGPQLRVGDTKLYCIQAYRGGVYGCHRGPVENALQAGRLL